MIVYFIMTGLTLIAGTLCTKSIAISHKVILKRGSAYLLVMAVMCILVMGFRDSSIGQDTQLYIRNFLRIGRYANLTDALANESNAIPVYVVLCRLIYAISPDPQFHIFVEAVLINVGFFAFIKRTSPNYVISTFLYFGLTIIYFAMNGARQSIAMVLCANAVVYLTKNFKSVKGWFLFLLGIGIHISGLITGIILLGVFLINKKKRNVKHLTTAFAIAGAFAGSAYVVLADLISKYFVHYAIYFNGAATVGVTETSGGGRIVVIYLYIAVFILLYFFQKGYAGEEHDELFCKILPGLAFGISFGIINCKNELINRLILFFFVYYVSYLPYVIKRCNANIKRILTAITLAGFFLYSLLFLYENQGAIVPYVAFFK